MPLFLIFVIIPLIEISLFVTLGEEIGLLPTLLLCVVTAIFGAKLVQQQGIETLTKAQQRAEQGQVPLEQLFDGFCICIAGVTLITPGFFTDIMGFLLLAPAVRRWLLSRAKRNGANFGFSGQFYSGRSDTVIEGEFEEVNDNAQSDPPEDDETKKLK